MTAVCISTLLIYTNHEHESRKIYTTRHDYDLYDKYMNFQFSLWCGRKRRGKQQAAHSLSQIQHHVYSSRISSSIHIQQVLENTSGRWEQRTDTYIHKYVCIYIYTIRSTPAVEGTGQTAASTRPVKRREWSFCFACRILGSVLFFFTAGCSRSRSNIILPVFFTQQ